MTWPQSERQTILMMAKLSFESGHKHEQIVEQGSKYLNALCTSILKIMFLDFSRITVK